MAGSDPDVQTPFALGWHVAELAHMSPGGGAGASKLPVLPQIRDLNFDQRVQLLLAQIGVELRAVALPPGEPAPPGAPAISVDGIKAVDGQFAEGAIDNLRTLHEAVLARLTAADFRVGKAYALGVALAETVLFGYKICVGETSVSNPSSELNDLFGEARVMAVARQLLDLKSNFQPYAVDATASTLADWGRWVRSHSSEFKFDSTGKAPIEAWAKVPDDLYTQGQLWRALLSGEKLPTDTLQVPDYVTAAQEMLRQYVGFAHRVLRHGAPLILLSLTVVAVAITVALLFLNQLQAAYASLIAFLGLFGVTGTSVVAAVKKALSQVQDQLWQSELAAAIAVSINKLPTPVADSSVRRLREPS